MAGEGAWGQGALSGTGAEAGTTGVDVPQACGGVGGWGAPHTESPSQEPLQRSLPTSKGPHGLGQEQ